MRSRRALAGSGWRRAKFRRRAAWTSGDQVKDVRMGEATRESKRERIRGPPKRLRENELRKGRKGGRAGLQPVKENVCRRVDFDALGVDIGELRLPPLDDNGTICVVGCVGGAEDVRCDVWTRADMLVEFSTDGEGRVGHGTTCGWTRYDCIHGYVCWTKGKVVYRPWEGHVRPGIVLEHEGDVGNMGEVGHE